MGLWEQWSVSLVSTAHFRPAATGGPHPWNMHRGKDMTFPSLSLRHGYQNAIHCHAEEGGEPYEIDDLYVFLVHYCVWVVLMQAVWLRSRSRVYECPQEPVLVLKEGETIAAVADWPNDIRFYTEIDVVGGKSEA